MASDRAVLNGNDVFSILVASTKERYSSFLKKVFVSQKICFKVKVLKTFETFAIAVVDLEGRPPFFVCNHLFFCNYFEELQTALIEVKLIINNASLTYVYPNTIKTCLTLLTIICCLADSYFIIQTQHPL